jgi:hypothetical protein
LGFKIKGLTVELNSETSDSVNAFICFDKTSKTKILLLNDKGEMLYSYHASDKRVDIGKMGKGKYALTFDKNIVEIELN